MLKRLASWRGIRWLSGGLAAAVLALAVAWLLFVPAANWLARYDAGSARGPLLQTSRDAARSRLLTLGAGLLAAGALAFTARTFYLSREGQVTDRYTKAIEQLGSDKLDVRIGGIYALERVARDSASDHPTVIEVLSAFIREHSREPWPLRGLDEDSDPVELTRPDVQAAVTVLARRDAKRDTRPIDLTGADLRRANLRGARLARADLAGARLEGTHLDGAYLDQANLTRASLAGADLLSAELGYANLYLANLREAHLENARLGRANLGGADLTGASLQRAKLPRAALVDATLTDATLSSAALTNADLTNADLTRAILSHANLARARLYNADLSGAYLVAADLTGADLTLVRLADADLGGVRWPEGTPVPEGWELGARFGLRRRGDIGLGSAEGG